MKRSDVISWDDYFYGISTLTAKRSKDPNTQVGACIVDTRNRIVGIGYNGFPRGCSDDEFSWDKPEKYKYVIHAEINAIHNKIDYDITGCSIYVTHHPCNECAKSIIQSGIKHVYYINELSDQYNDMVIASKKMFTASGVTLTHR